jgi:signal transduction histidine kinase
MKHKWSHLLRDAAPWLWLLLLSDGFFIFLAWLASPDSFWILVGVMIAFSLGCAGVGVWIVYRKRQGQEAAFQSFISDPSLQHEADLVKICAPSLAEPVHLIGASLRKQTRLLTEYEDQVIEFEEFIEAWVHEIKTPLSLATLLLANRQDEMSDSVYIRFEHVRREISEEVDRILYYARLQSVHIDYRYERVLLADCGTEVLSDLRSLFEEHEATVTQDLGDVEVVSDVKTLQFVISQIILNSIKYAKEGSGPVVHLSAGEIPDREQFYLRISDEGIGVPEADLPFIFDKGFTGNHPQRRKATGMGLYLVKKFCDDMQIEIEVESRVGEGLTTTLYFPVVRGEQGNNARLSYEGH